jgi:hypothetical protein
MNYELHDGEVALNQDAIYQEIAVLGSASAYDNSKGLDEQDPFPEHDEAVKGITGPLDETGAMVEGYEVSAISGYWLWTIYGNTWILRMPWIRIRP